MFQAMRPLWPETQRVPLLRLARAFVIAPLLLAALLAVGATLVSGTAGARAGDPLQTFLNAAATLSTLSFLFALTFGLPGMLLLGAAGMRGTLPWAVMGGVMGAAAGGLYSVLAGGTDIRVTVLATAIIGWLLFLMLRWQAGVKADAPRRRSRLDDD